VILWQMPYCTIGDNPRKKAEKKLQKKFGGNGKRLYLCNENQTELASYIIIGLDLHYLI